MKTTIGFFFGGRSVEHEISVISALQAMAAIDTERYNVVPVYLNKHGMWFTGDVLRETAAYRNPEALERRAVRVWMRPEMGNRVLWKNGMFGPRRVAELDVAFPVFHGTNGEDGTFQGLLELIGVPYVGPGVLSSALGMDKVAMKMVLRECGLPVLDWVWFTDREWSGRNAGGEPGYARNRDTIIAQIEREVGYPAIVKPANLGSSVGISRAMDRAGLVDAVAEAVRYSSRVLVERMVEPLREINCSVRGSADDCTASVCEEPLRSGEILSYADKYLSGGGAKGGNSKLSSRSETSYAKLGGAKAFGAGKGSGGMSSTQRRIPAELPENLTADIGRLARETFRVLGCEGIARIDFILDGEAVYVNEINTIPGSLSFYLWAATGRNGGNARGETSYAESGEGVGFDTLLDDAIRQALKRAADRTHKTVSYPANIFNM